MFGAFSEFLQSCYCMWLGLALTAFMFIEGSIYIFMGDDDE